MAWFDGSGQVRLDHDKAIVAELTPELHHEIQPDGHMALVGDVGVKTSSGVAFRIATQVDFPDEYPRQEPVAREVGDRFLHDADHHFFDSNVCCLWLDVESKWRASDPDALRVFLLELGVFYQRQLVMEAQPGRGYPGPQRAHGVEAYLDHAVERWRLTRGDLHLMIKALTVGVSRNAPCPCGSRVRYRKCHRQRITTFRDRIRNDQLERLIAALRTLR